MTAARSVAVSSKVVTCWVRAVWVGDQGSAFASLTHVPSPPVRSRYRCGCSVSQERRIEIVGLPAALARIIARELHIIVVARVSQRGCDEKVAIVLRMEKKRMWTMRAAFRPFLVQPLGALKCDANKKKTCSGVLLGAEENAFFGSQYTRAQSHQEQS